MGCRIARPLRRDQKSPPSDVCLVAACKEVGGRSLVPDGQVFQPRAILTVGTLGEDSADRRGLSQEEMRLLSHLALVAGGPGRTARRPRGRGRAARVQTFAVLTHALFTETLKFCSPEKPTLQFP